MIGLSDITRTSRVRSLTARELPLAVEGYLVYCTGASNYSDFFVKSFPVCIDGQVVVGEQYFCGV